MTTAELLELFEIDDPAALDPIPKGHELIDGELVEKPEMGEESSWVLGRMFRLIDEWCERTKGGVALTGDAGFRCFPDRPRLVRKPDVSVLAVNPDTYAPVRGEIRGVPVLVVEVVSPNDRVYDLDAKVQEFLQAGTRLVWIVNPELRTVLIRRPDGSLQLLTDPAELTGEDILPGFSTPLAAFMPRRAAPTP